MSKTIVSEIIERYDFTKFGISEEDISKYNKLQLFQIFMAIGQGIDYRVITDYTFSPNKMEMIRMLMSMNLEYKHLIDVPSDYFGPVNKAGIATYNQHLVCLIMQQINQLMANINEAVHKNPIDVMDIPPDYLVYCGINANSLVDETIRQMIIYYNLYQTAFQSKYALEETFDTINLIYKFVDYIMSKFPIKSHYKNKQLTMYSDICIGGKYSRSYNVYFKYDGTQTILTLSFDYPIFITD